MVNYGLRCILSWRIAALSSQTIVKNKRQKYISELKYIFKTK